MLSRCPPVPSDHYIICVIFKINHDSPQSQCDSDTSANASAELCASNIKIILPPTPVLTQILTNM